jgi:hypothetical protein
MKRDSFGFKFKHQPQPLYAKLLHECWCCHVVGLKPGVLATHLGDYGMRDFLRRRYQESDLSPEGLCAECAATPRPKSESSVQR